MKKNTGKKIVTVLYPVTMFVCMTGIIISVISMFTDFGYGDIKIYVLQIIGCVALMILAMCVLSPVIDDKDDKNS